MLLSPFTLSTKVYIVAACAAVVAMVVVGQRLKIAEARAEIAELKATIAGYQAAVEIQAQAAKADSERLNRMAAEASNAARASLTRGRQEKRASIVPGTGSEVMNKWLDDTFTR